MNPQNDHSYAAADWLVGVLAAAGGESDSAAIKAAAKREGISERTLQRALMTAGVVAQRYGFPSRTVWRLDPAAVTAAPQSPGDPAMTMNDTETDITTVSRVNDHIDEAIAILGDDETPTAALVHAVLAVATGTATTAHRYARAARALAAIEHAADHAADDDDPSAALAGLIESIGAAIGAAR